MASTSVAKLKLNILTFVHPEEQYTFYFTDKEDKNLSRVFHTLVPDEVINHFGEQDHYYTSFDQPEQNYLPVTKNSNPTFKREWDDSGREKRVLVHNVSFTRSILKRYYNKQIKEHFEKKGILVKPNFVSDIEIWIPATKKDPQYNLFEKYTLRVQIARITDQPELLLTYAGISKVFKSSVTDLLSEVSTEAFNWLIYENKLFKFEEAPEEVRANYDNAYPVWNFMLRDELGQSTEAPDKGNKYLKFAEKINGFMKNHIFQKDFTAIIPIDTKKFITAPTVGSVTENSNQLLFGKKYGKHQTGIVPYYGIKNNGPFAISPHKKIQFFYIMHQEDEDAAKKIEQFFRGKKTGFGGLQSFAKTYYGRQSGFSIFFENKSNPVPEISKGLETLNFQQDTRYIGIYISPINKYDTDKTKREVYYKVKELLLKYRVTSQVIEAEKVRTKEDYHFSMPNIAIAVLSKLDGLPWQLDTTLTRELIVGIGAFKHRDTNVQYVGSAFSFQNNGKFNRFECFRKKQTDELAGSIIRAVNDYASTTDKINRLVIHFYKSMSKTELEPIETAIRELKYDFPIFIVSINKTESSDLIAFDDQWPQLMPKSGTFVKYGYNRYLLFNNTRYENSDSFKAREGFPFPIKLSIDCSDPEEVKDSKVIKQLINQVYQFSRMYWKSVSQQNLPVTIKYPEMVAEMFPHFTGDEIPDFGKDNLWFL